MQPTGMHGRRERIRGRTGVLWAGWAVAGLGMIGLLAHFAEFGSSTFIGVAAFASYLMATLPIAALIFGFGRRWVHVAFVVALMLGCAAVQAPLYVAAPSGHSTGPTVSMLTANLRLGNGDPTTIVQLVRRDHIDVFAAEELTPDERAAFGRAGLDAALPYNLTDSRRSAGGSGLWSRFPLNAPHVLYTYTFAFVYANVVVPGSHKPVTVVATHMPGPWPQPPHQWLLDMRRLPTTLRSLSDSGGPVLVGGDFNATYDVAQFRRLLSGGYHDAAEQVGAGMTRTYPADAWYPPLIAIDHVLTYDAVARSVRTVTVPGSDHRGLLVTVRLPA